LPARFKRKSSQIGPLHKTGLNLRTFWVDVLIRYAALRGPAIRARMDLRSLELFASNALRVMPVR